MKPRWEVEEDLFAIVARIAKVPAQKISPDVDLRVRFNIDSLLGLEIIASLEKTYQISIPEEDFGAVRTIREMMDLLTRLGVCEAEVNRPG